jgi:hypothetical protein
MSPLPVSPSTYPYECPLQLNQQAARPGAMWRIMGANNPTTDICAIFVHGILPRPWLVELLNLEKRTSIRTLLTL